MTEYYNRSLVDVLHHHRQHAQNSEHVLKICYQIASGLAHLNSMGLVCHNLEPANVLVVNDSDTIKLFNYGLYHMTYTGDYVTFPIG